MRQMIGCRDADALRSVSLVVDTPYKMWRIENERLTPLLTLPGFPEAHSAPRQKLPQVYFQNGYVDVIRSRTILEKASMCGDTVLPLIVEGHVPDLDHPQQIPALMDAVGKHKESLEKPT